MAVTTLISENDQQDIEELKQKVSLFRAGLEDEERFKHYRLTRGVYGQRQEGVHMFRTKLPLGKISSQQLNRLADVSHKYATGNLHLTTRQNIQFHYVTLENSIKVWEELAEVGVNAREACGNTVRNITASANAGIDPHEPFNVSPYAMALYDYFLRHPVCQEMGRKIKIAFSSSEFDTAFTYFHDFGFIPKIESGKRGFKLAIAGGLGAQSIVAQKAFDFIPANEIIPFVEATLRVFDRYGEREKRFKARMKYLVKALGIKPFLQLVEAEKKSLTDQLIPIDPLNWNKAKAPAYDPEWKKNVLSGFSENEIQEFENWKETNVSTQKQEGFLAIGLKVTLGDLNYKIAQQLAQIVPLFAADDIRITVNQDLLLRFVHPDALPSLYIELKELGLAQTGYSSIADITACPGTDTCNLAVTNSTNLSEVLEETIRNEYPDFLTNKDIQIKISGCMNSCGQHMAAQIGFHGSSFKVKGLVAPAMQVVLGGGIEPNGKTYIGEKVIKLPTKRLPDTIRKILDVYKLEQELFETFNEFYYAKGKAFFYELLKPLANKENLKKEDFQDWGEKEEYIQAIGVGECAGVAVDVLATILNDAQERLIKAEINLAQEQWGAAIYNSYSAQVIFAKALLLADDVACNTHAKIISDFQELYVESGRTILIQDFEKTLLEMKNNEPTEKFARNYFQTASSWFNEAEQLRENQLIEAGQDKLVISQHYNA